MAIVEVPSPRDSEIVEALLLDLLDPENNAYALSALPKVILFLLYVVYFIAILFTWHKMTLEEQLVLNLCDPELRGNALIKFSKERKMFKAPLLWYYSFVTIAALFQEIVLVYPAISSPTLSASEANRACNALALLQTVAAHPKTRTPFLEAGIPLYLFLFLNATSKAKSFEYLRVRSLGVPSSLAKVDDTEVVKFLLKSKVIPLCLQIMGTGSELSKTVATFIVQKIMLDEAGLQHISATAECFFQAACVLANMVTTLTEQPSTKHVIPCYLWLTDDPRACTALRAHLPKDLRNGDIRQLP